MSAEPPNTMNRVLQLGLAALGGGVLVALGVVISTVMRPAPSAPAAAATPAAATPAAAVASAPPAAPVHFDPQLGVAESRVLSSAADRNGTREYALKLTLDVANLPNPPADVIVKVGGEEAAVTRQPADLGYDMTLVVNASGPGIQSRLNSIEKSHATAPLNLELFDKRNPSHAFVASTYTLPHDLLNGNVVRELAPRKNTPATTKPASTTTDPPPPPPAGYIAAPATGGAGNPAAPPATSNRPGVNNPRPENPPPPPDKLPARIADASGKTTTPAANTGGKAEMKAALLTLTAKDRQQIVKLANDAIRAADKCLDDRAVFAKCKGDITDPPQKLVNFLHSKNITVFPLLEQRLHPDGFDGVRLLKSELNAIVFDAAEADR
jgi:hypothetical protein